ncbi:hypothetical protein [Sphingobacterium detergens]|uniref:hypothetical protein n=1 Tax=Sphingobacterium detergens TaxID=1145106 RepID=UPI003AAB1BEA
MIEEITKTSTEIVKKTADKLIEPIWNRLSNPLIASFTISWILWNWQAILFLIFSRQSIECKFPYINNTFYNWNLELWTDLHLGWLAIFCKCILLPFISSLAYILLLPKFDNFFDKINEEPLKTKNEKILKDEKEKIRRKGELEEKLAEIEEKIFNIKNKLSDGETVSSLKERITTLNDQVTNLITENEKIVNDNIEQTTIIKSTFQNQINSLENTLKKQANRLTVVTEEREKFRSDLDEYQQGSVQLEMELHNLRNSLDLSKKFTVRLVDTIVSHSTFNEGIDHVRAIEVVNEIKDDEDYISKLGDLVGKAKINDSVVYLVTIGHDDIMLEHVITEVNHIIGLLGGMKVTEQRDETTFTFSTTRSLDRELFKDALSNYAVIKHVDISEVG